ncbi:hypothetical protein AB1N83_013596 [Pleurotus pulmonarius]
MGQITTRYGLVVYRDLRNGRGLIALPYPTQLSSADSVGDLENKSTEFQCAPHGSDSAFSIVVGLQIERQDEARHCRLPLLAPPLLVYLPNQPPFNPKSR